MSSYHAKLTFRGETRRVSSSTFEELEETVSSTFQIKDFSLVYIDADGDKISVSSTPELLEAFRAVHPKGLKIIVEKKRELSPSRCGEQNSSSCPERKSSEQKSCTACSKSIEGPHYQCTVCPSTLLCLECENEHEPSHTLLKVRASQGNGPFSGCRRIKCCASAFTSLVLLSSLRELSFCSAVLTVFAISLARQRMLESACDCSHSDGCKLSKITKWCRPRGKRLVGVTLVMLLLVRSLPFVILVPLVFLVHWLASKDRLRHLLKRLLGQLKGDMYAEVTSLVRWMVKNYRADPVAQSRANPVPAASPFDASLKLLADMGFRDRDACLDLLRRFKGDVEAVCQELLR